MSRKQYGEWLAMIWSATPGGWGMYGVLTGVQQERLGVTLSGAVLVAVAAMLVTVLTEKR